MNTDFEKKYQSEAEPWGYSERGAERLRHKWVAAQALSLGGPGARVLDMGCSGGQLTLKLAELDLKVTAVDISATAIEKAKNSIVNLTKNSVQFAVGSALEIPSTDASFDIVLFSDGLEGWELSPEQKLKALQEADRVLKPGGHLILTDYLGFKAFKSHIDLVGKGPLKIQAIHYLNDRLWFQINTNFSFLRGIGWYKGLMRSEAVASQLAKISSLMGARGSKHLAIVLKKS